LQTNLLNPRLQFMYKTNSTGDIGDWGRVERVFGPNRGYGIGRLIKLASKRLMKIKFNQQYSNILGNDAAEKRYFHESRLKFAID